MQTLHDNRVSRFLVTNGAIDESLKGAQTVEDVLSHKKGTYYGVVSMMIKDTGFAVARFRLGCSLDLRHPLLQILLHANNVIFGSSQFGSLLLKGLFSFAHYGRVLQGAVVQ